MTQAQTPMPDFAGRLALVTGGLGAIGAATCAALRARGARVVAADAHAPVAGPGVDLTQGEGVHLNVTDAASLRALVARVQTTSDKLGYVPDPAARALASQRSDHVALLIPLLSNALFVDLLESAQGTLRQAGFQTLIGVTHYDSREEEQSSDNGYVNLEVIGKS
jgi:NAD(P)-dependent dehydrogenase (short-subunit alcohol dehydrogenase family)